MADEPTHIRLIWLTAQGTTEPITVPVRRVSERAAFAMLATSHGPGTRGTYELLDAAGDVLREGSCRIIFQRQGAGVGLELLAKPPLLRSSVPAPRRTSIPVPKRDLLPPSATMPQRRDFATKDTLPGPGLQAQRRAARRRVDSDQKIILGSTPPAKSGETNEDVAPDTMARGSSLPPPPRPPSEASAPTKATPFDIEKDERPPNVHVTFPPLSLSPPDPVRPETERSSADTEPPPPLELPELPKWDPPPPSPPPPRYDPGSWEPPVYTPAALESDPALQALEKSHISSQSSGEAKSIPPSPQSDAVETSLVPPRLRLDALSAPNSLTPTPPSLRESRTPSAPTPPRSERPSLAAQSQRKARVATRVSRSAVHGVAIGIDLGTSNTCASAVIDGVPRVIPTRFGTNTVPSVLTVIDSRVVVGHLASKRMITNPHETIYGSKRLVGRAFTPEIADEYQPSFAYPLVESEDHRFGASLNGRVISFEQVAEYLLAEVRDVAERHLGQNVISAVITVPAYFGEAQREAIRRAARGAQLGLDRIVPEPTAAAVAYGYNANDDCTLVVFDLGGGTFDVSVLRLGKNRYEVLATGGDAFLGGIDVDDLIAGYFIEEFQRAERTTLEPTPQQLARLRDAAEVAKRDLSVQLRVAINLPHFARIDGEPKELRATLTRAKLNELSTSFVDRLIDVTKATLNDCGLSAHDIDDVILVGGMTRMAMVPARVEEFFGRRPSRRINPDEAVALGAARLAESGGNVELLDVLPLSIGVASQGRAFQRLLTRNTQVPMQRAFSVRTKEKDQDTFRLPLFQGEQPDAADNEYLGTLMVEEIPPGPAGSELELLLILDEQCFLEVRAAHVASGRGLAVYINREEGAEKAIAALDAYAGPEKEEKKEEPKGLGRFFKRLRSFFS